MSQDVGTAFRLLHPAAGSGSDAPPAVLALLSAALRAHVDAAAAAEGPVQQQEEVGGSGRLTKFHAATPPRIEVEAYLDRLFKHSKCSPVCLVMAFAYIRRLAAADAALRPSHMNVHRMLISGLVVGIKLSDDRYFTNTYYSQVGGVSLAELNALELHMLSRLGYRAHVGVSELVDCLQHIQSAAAGGAAWVLSQQQARQEQPGPCGTPAAKEAPPSASTTTAAPPAPASPEGVEAPRYGLHQLEAGWGAVASPLRMMPPEWPCGSLATSPLAGCGSGPRTPFSCPRDTSTSCTGSPFAASAALGCKQEHAEAGSVEGVTVCAS